MALLGVDTVIAHDGIFDIGPGGLSDLRPCKNPSRNDFALFRMLKSTTKEIQDWVDKRD